MSTTRPWKPSHLYKVFRKDNLQVRSKGLCYGLATLYTPQENFFSKAKRRKTLGFQAWVIFFLLLFWAKIHIMWSKLIDCINRCSSSRVSLYHNAVQQVVLTLQCCMNCVEKETPPFTKHQIVLFSLQFVNQCIAWRCWILSFLQHESSVSRHMSGWQLSVYIDARWSGLYSPKFVQTLSYKSEAVTCYFPHFSTFSSQ